MTRWENRVISFFYTSSENVNDGIEPLSRGHSATSSTGLLEPTRLHDNNILQSRCSFTENAAQKTADLPFLCKAMHEKSNQIEPGHHPGPNIASFCLHPPNTSGCRHRPTCTIASLLSHGMEHEKFNILVQSSLSPIDVTIFHHKHKRASISDCYPTSYKSHVYYL